MASAIGMAAGDVAVTIVVTLVIFLAPALATARAAQDNTSPTSRIAGAWALDPFISDHPEQVARAIRIDIGEGSAEETPAGAAGARGGPERDPGRGADDLARRGAARGSPREPISESARKVLTELTDAVRFPPATLTITQTETTVTIAGAGTVTLQPDGRPETERLARGSVDRTATWEGPQLVIRYAVAHAGILTYTYAVAPTTGQLVVRINFERPGGEPGPFEIKLVYNRA